MGEIVEKIGMIIYLVYIGVSSLFGAKCHVSKDCVECNFRIEEGFSIMEIKVAGYDKDGTPVNYKEVNRFRCAPFSNLSSCLGDEVYSDEEKKILQEKWQIRNIIMKLNGGTIGGPEHSRRITEYIDCKNVMDSIEDVNFPFIPRKSIYFYESTKNYKWGETVESKVWGGIYFFDCEKGIRDTLPIMFATNKWYLIDLSNQAQYVHKLFFKVKEHGKIEQHYSNYVNYD
jgi:hypothetical protein